MKQELAILEAHETTSLESALVNLKAKGIDVVSPNEFLCSVYMDEEEDTKVRIMAAKEAKAGNKESPATPAVIVVNNATSNEKDAKPSFDMDDI
jgi:hypothetical protein